ncbi:MAG: hypothetical protein WCD43_15720 [Candidatus Acidiferrales bacterium]
MMKLSMTGGAKSYKIFLAVVTQVAPKLNMVNLKFGPFSTAPASPIISFQHLATDTNMTESITDAFKCNQCGALYDSEKELLEHQQAVRHAVVSDRKPQETSERESVNQQAKAKAKNA